MSRRAAVLAVAGLVPLVIAGCRSGPKRSLVYEPLSWDYLPRLHLNVASIDIDGSWQPRPEARDIGALAPVPPPKALVQMANDRLAADGTSGRALFIVEDASLTRTRGSYFGHFAVRLEISSGDGRRRGFAEARVARSRPIEDDSPPGMRAELYDMIKQMMSDMNVEFEYQARRSLADFLLSGAQAPATPAPGEEQELPPPSATAPAAAPGRAAPPTSRPAAVPFAVPGPTPLAP
jgi:hypothetical protein